MPKREDIELVRSLYETLNKGGSQAVIARIKEFSDPEIEWIGVGVGSDAPGGHVTYRGYDGIRRFWEEFEEVFEEIHFSDVRVEAFGEGVVLAIVHGSGIGRGSGIQIDHEMGIVYRLRNGRILRGEIFPSQDEARATAIEAANA